MSGPELFDEHNDLKTKMIQYKSFIAPFNILFIVRGYWGRRVTQVHLERVDPEDL